MLTRGNWIFDLDGTLTIPVHDFAAIRRALAVPEHEGILEYIGRQPAARQHRLNRRLNQIERALAHRAQPAAGAAELLDYLHQRGCRLGIFTRNLGECVTITLNRLGFSGYFDARDIVAREDAPPKPDPAGIRRLLHRWRAVPEQCLIIGDYRYDLDAGRRAGIATIHYRAHRQESWPDLTDLEVRDFPSLLRLLEP